MRPILAKFILVNRRLAAVFLLGLTVAVGWTMGLHALCLVGAVALALTDRITAGTRPAVKDRVSSRKIATPWNLLLA